MGNTLQAQPETRASELQAALAPEGLPAHVAVIMDGNGRWGEGHGMSRVYGHQGSVEAVRRAVTAADDLGIQFLSLFCFSTENIERPSMEVVSLFTLFMDTLDRETEELYRKNVRILTTGLTDRLPDGLAEKFSGAVRRTSDNTGLTLNLCVMYSGRTELLHAVRSVATAAKAGKLDPEELDEEGFRGFLLHPDVPDPDLVIRTSGEQRISNFLLWQMAYSELVFTEVLWPDFGRADFLAALCEYQRRTRRFGKV